jgi:5-methylcytosine-specific restriction endonuclease McrA
MPTRPPRACTAPGCPLPQPCPRHPSRRWSDGARGRVMPPGWSSTRARALARDGYRCQWCGAPATEVHHTQPGREDDASLVSLCHSCHLAVTLRQARAARNAQR